LELSADTLSAIPGLALASEAIRHAGTQRAGSDPPDRTGPAGIAFAANLFSLCDVLVGNPAVGFLPSWDITLKAVQRSDKRFDPDLVRLVASVDLHSIAIPKDRVDAIVEHFIDAPEAAPPFTPQAHSTRAVDHYQHPVLTTVLHASEPDRLLGLMADSIMAEFGAAAVSFLELAPNGTELTAVARRGEHTMSLAFESRLRDYSAVTELNAGSVQHGDHTLGIPIQRGAKPWGALVVIRHEDQPVFTKDDLERLEHQVEAAAHTISVSEEWARLERMATRDQLTGLANRHELNQAIDAIFTRPPTDRLDSAVIMCDVDGLKAVNDSLGHDAGDQLLIDAATALRSATRDPDRTTICRIGGDEFCVVIDGGALLTAHEMSNAIERLFARSASSGTPRSISCGVAFADHDVANRSELLKAADENQYRVKRQRRKARGEPIEDHRDGDRRARR